MKKTILQVLAFSMLAFTTMTACVDEVNEFENAQEPIEKDVIPTEDGEVVTEGHVDLGLSVEWAACNLGTQLCYDLGTQYKWGDLSTNCLDDICGTEYDQATDEIGKNWRLPTKDQLEELINKCRWHATTYRGKYGYIVTGPSKKAIFLPVSTQYYYGNYWTGSLDISTNKAFSLGFRSSGYLHDEYMSYCPKILSTDRQYHYDNYIRPVYKSSWK